MPERPVTTPARRRRWLQFSVRSLLIFMLLVSVPLGGLAYRINKVRQQRVAVAEIRKLGGTAMYCHLYETPDDWSEHCPSWLREMLGDEFFETINYVDLNQQAITDENVSYLRALPQLRSLHLNGTQVTDAGLIQIPSLALLESLSLDGTKITDRGLVHIGKLPNLQRLDMSGTEITDDGLAEIPKWAELETLALKNTKVTDAGLIHLQRCKVLRDVDLENTQVTDAGVEALKQALPKLDIHR